MRAYHGPEITEMKTGMEEVKTKDLKASSEEVEAIVEHQRVPDKEATVETTRALEDRCGDCKVPQMASVVGPNRKPPMDS
jgi:hypothetical protein